VFNVPFQHKYVYIRDETFARPRGWTEVANWRYFPFLPTSIHQESPNDIIIQTKLTLTLTLTRPPVKCRPADLRIFKHVKCGWFYLQTWWVKCGCRWHAIL